MNTAMPLPPHGARTYVPSINGFRGVCVGLVFAHHVANSGLPPKPPPDSFWLTQLFDLFMSFGYGVELFFMISGYVIVMSLRRHASVGQFLKDRVLRIFPVWVPVIVCVTLAGTLGGWKVFANADPLRWSLIAFGNLFLLPPLVPLPLAHTASWSLTYEWVFYLTAALGAVLSRRPATPQILLVIWAVAAALLIACFPRGLYFLPGVLIALVPVIADRAGRHAYLAWFSLPVFLLTWYATGVFAAEYSKPLWQVFTEGSGVAALVALAAATHLFACVASPAPRGLSFLKNRAVQYLGTISYSFYLMHPLAMFAVKKLVTRWMPEAHGNWTATIAFTIGSALLAWLLSHLSWRYLEQGLARWLKARWHTTGDSVRPSVVMSAPADSLHRSGHTAP